MILMTQQNKNSSYWIFFLLLSIWFFLLFCCLCFYRFLIFLIFLALKRYLCILNKKIYSVLTASMVTMKEFFLLLLLLQVTTGSRSHSFVFPIILTRGSFTFYVYILKIYGESKKNYSSSTNLLFLLIIFLFQCPINVPP